MHIHLTVTAVTMVMMTTTIRMTRTTSPLQKPRLYRRLVVMRPNGSGASLPAEAVPSMLSLRSELDPWNDFRNVGSASVHPQCRANVGEARPPTVLAMVVARQLRSVHASNIYPCNVHVALSHTTLTATRPCKRLQNLATRTQAPHQTVFAGSWTNLVQYIGLCKTKMKFRTVSLSCKNPDVEQE